MLCSPRLLDGTQHCCLGVQVAKEISIPFCKAFKCEIRTKSTLDFHKMNRMSIQTLKKLSHKPQKSTTEKGKVPDDLYVDLNESKTGSECSIEFKKQTNWCVIITT